MKKTLLFLLLIVFGLLLSNSSNAITQTQIDSTVQIVCPDNYGNWFSGSGTMIDSKGIILTNKHVVTDEYGGIIDTCFIGFIESISEEPNFGTETNPNLADVKYYTTSNDMDTAILYLDNPTNKSYPYVNIWDSNSNDLQFGNKIEVLGFPGVGGSTVTYTSGDFSGFGSSSYGTQNYIKTTASLEHGNSGGSSYNSTEQFIGIPTMVVPGELNSISYILSINSIKNWLSNKLSSNYKQEIITQSPEIKSPSKSIQDDIIPPKLKGHEIDYKIVNDHNLKKSFVEYTIPIANIVESSAVKNIYYYFGKEKTKDPLLYGKTFETTPNKDIVIPEKFELIEGEEYFFIIRLEDEYGNISNSIISPWKITYALKVGLEKALYNEAINNFKYTNSGILNKYAGYFIRNNEIIWWVSPRDDVRYIVYSPNLGIKFLSETLNTWYGSNWNGLSVSTGITTSDLAKKPKHVWGHLLSERADDGSGSMGNKYYIYPKSGELIDFDPIIGWGEDGNHLQTGVEALSLIESILIDISDDEINYIEPLGKDNRVAYGIDYAKEHNQIPEYGFSFNKQNIEKESSESENNLDTNLSNRLKGKLLLQVNQGGRIWYVNPNDSKRFEITFANALPLFENFALGISNSDLDDIPEHSDSWTSALGNRLKGKLLLQVEQGGRIWYVDFDGKRWEVTWDNLMELFESLALGITDDDSNKISAGEL